jgi:hypothetical protein
MSIESKTVAEIKEILTQKELKFPKRATKARLIEILNEYHGQETVEETPKPPVKRMAGEY